MHRHCFAHKNTYKPVKIHWFMKKTPLRELTDKLDELEVVYCLDIEGNIQISSNDFNENSDPEIQVLLTVKDKPSTPKHFSLFLGAIVPAINQVELARTLCTYQHNLYSICYNNPTRESPKAKRCPHEKTCKAVTKALIKYNNFFRPGEPIPLNFF